MRRRRKSKCNSTLCPPNGNCVESASEHENEGAAGIHCPQEVLLLVLLLVLQLAWDHRWVPAPPPPSMP